MSGVVMGSGTHEVGPGPLCTEEQEHSTEENGTHLVGVRLVGSLTFVILVHGMQGHTMDPML